MSKSAKKPPSEASDHAFNPQQDDSVPDHVAGSGVLDRLADRAQDYARQAIAENTARAYAKDWADLSRWC
ncbi:MAG: integrase, partial [Paracoccus sp. (in: a-proteobacteria)]